jgi:hypothetical protein
MRRRNESLGTAAAATRWPCVTNRQLSSAAAAAAAALLLMLAGCRAEPQQAAESPSPVALGRLMRGNVADSKPLPLRLAALRPGDVGSDFAGKPTCRLTSGADTLLVATGGEAVARVDGQVRRIAKSGPVDASGAFFSAPGIAVSIGGRDPRTGPGPAHVTVSGAGEDPPQKIEGVWSCPT